jgi:hypothetical protein
VCNLCGSAQVKYVAAYPDVGKAICCVQGIGWACHRETRGDLTNSVERARRPMFNLGLTACRREILEFAPLPPNQSACAPFHANGAEETRDGDRYDDAHRLRDRRVDERYKVRLERRDESKADDQA